MTTCEKTKRLEQVWLVLSNFFEDLYRRNVSVNLASDLRDCKTLIHFIRTSVTHASKESMAIDASLRNLQLILDKVKSCLITEALKLGVNYAKEWIEKIDIAERAELVYPIIYITSQFIPGIPVDPEERFVRLTLQKPIAEERVQDVAEQFGVITEFKNECHISISGKRDSVRKATKDIYELSLEEPL